MIRILIVGTGGMANEHAKGYKNIPNATVVAGVDTNAERLAAFQVTHNIPHGFASVDAAIAWSGFDAVSNVTPDGVHYATTLPFLAAGKHVLCEKPLAANYSDAAEMADAATRAGVANMVNLSYREGPAMVHAAAMIARGDIGDVRHFEASYLQSWLTQPAWGDWATEDQWLWRLSTQHGSMGVLGDVGVHILDYATYVAGSDPARMSCRLTTFDKVPGNQIGAYPLDANDSFHMHTVLENGAAGVIHASRFASGHFNDLSLKIYGTKGGLEVTSINRNDAQVGTLRASIGADMMQPKWVDVAVPEVQTNYARFINAVQGGTKVAPDFQRGAVLQKVLDTAVTSDRDQSRDLPLA